MVIDSHVHIYLAKEDLSRCENEVEKLLDCMNRVGIDKVCLAPMVISKGSNGYYPEKSNILFAADFLTELMKTYNDRFFSLIWVNGYLDPRFLVSLTDKYILHGMINGIKLCNETNARDERLEPFASFLEENGVPVLFHSWYSTEGRTYCDSTPSDIAFLAEKHPGLRIAMAHLNGCRCRGIQDIKKLPNVSIDTSGSAGEDGYLEYAIKELGPDRVLYGSDYPGRDFAAQLARIDSVELTPEAKNKLLCENAAKLFGRREKCI